jgi:glycerol-1-phosphate dehydrogenase [NAD(P)+]
MVTWNVSYEGITSNFQNVRDFIVFTMNPPWERCVSYFPHSPKKVVYVKDLEGETLEEYIKNASALKVDYVVGVGGGQAIDAAKFVALKTGLKFIAIPTIVSVNAYVTPRAAVRTEGIVNYIGDKFADLIVIDYSIIKTAPPRLNTAGVGDIYSTKIGLMDWKLANEKYGDQYDQDTVNEGERIVAKLLSKAGEIRAVSDAGIRTLVELHQEITSLQRPYTLQRVKSSKSQFHGLWPEEGSEHVFFYSLEKQTGRTFTHGEIVGAGTVISAYLHRRDTGPVIKDLDSFGLMFRPRDSNISRSEFGTAIHNMQKVALAMGLDYPVLSQEIEEKQVGDLWRLLS